MRMRTILLTLPLLVMLTACASDKQFEFDYRYSMNLIKVPDWYPDKADKLSVAEEEVLFRMGRPDVVRIWWRPDGSLLTTSDLSGQIDTINKRVQSIDKSWLYLRDQQEVIFKNNGNSYSVRDMDDTMKLVSKYGDPNDRTPAQMRNGMMEETWIWYEHGLQVTMVDGVEMKRKFIPKTGEGTWLLK